MNKINITIEKEDNLQLILDEILKLKEEEIKLDNIYKNMIKKIEKIKKKIYIIENHLLSIQEHRHI